MKRISSYSGIEDDQVVLENGTRWTVAVGRQIDVTFWSYGDPVESEDFQPGGYLRKLGAQGCIPATRVDKSSQGAGEGSNRP